jgi:hypothetical protein
MTAPDRRPIMSSPFPKRLQQEAEAVVIQAARELVTRHPEIEDMKPLRDAVTILDQLKG